MASLVFNNAMLDSVTGDLDLEEGQNDIRVSLHMTNTTVDTEEETATNTAFTTLDEMDGAGYTAGGKTLASQAVAIDAVNDRVEFDFEDLVWTALSNGTRAIQGMMIYKFVTDYASSIPIAFIEFSATQNPGGSDFTVTIDAEGALHIKQGA